MRFVVVLKPQAPRFGPELANYVYRVMLANNLGSRCDDKPKSLRLSNVKRRDVRHRYQVNVNSVIGILHLIQGKNKVLSV